MCESGPRLEVDAEPRPTPDHDEAPAATGLVQFYRQVSQAAAELVIDECLRLLGDGVTGALRRIRWFGPGDGVWDEVEPARLLLQIGSRRHFCFVMGDIMAQPQPR